MRAVLLPARGNATVIELDGSVAAYHAAIGGYMEVFHTRVTRDPMDSVIGLCDEDGWRGTPIANVWSPYVSNRAHTIAGNILLVRAAPDGDFVSLTDDDIADINAMLPYAQIVIG